MPEVELDGAGNTVYSFKELQREKEALAQYRAAINPEASDLGKTVFDSGS
jgi:heme oxygenase